jgi:hypothetical protein
MADDFTQRFAGVVIKMAKSQASEPSFYDDQLTTASIFTPRDLNGGIVKWHRVRDTFFILSSS